MLIRVLIFFVFAVPAFAQSLPVVVDGDTIRYLQVTYRVFGVDTPETYQPICPAGEARDRERAAGEAATARTTQLAAEGIRFIGLYWNRDRRVAAVVHKPSNRLLSDILISEGYGVPNYGEKRTCRF